MTTGADDEIAPRREPGGGAPDHGFDPPGPVPRTESFTTSNTSSVDHAAATSSGEITEDVPFEPVSTAELEASLRPAVPWDVVDGPTRKISRNLAVVLILTAVAALIPMIVIPLLPSTPNDTPSPAAQDPAVVALNEYVTFWRQGGTPTTGAQQVLDSAFREDLGAGAVRFSLRSSETGVCWSVTVGGTAAPRPEKASQDLCP